MKPLLLALALGLGSTALGSLGCSAAAPASDTATGTSEGALLAGPLLSETAVASLLRGAGFPEADVARMVCTAKYESSFYEDASHANSNGTTDYGLWQINSVHLGSDGCASSAAALYDGATNAQCAREIYDAQGIGAWYAYTSHKSSCDAFTLPADPAAASPSSGSTSASGSGDDDDSDGGTADASESASESASSSGSCWSATLGEVVPADACVTSYYDGVEEQCVNGSWYSGVGDGVGPDGACVSED